MCVHTLGVKSEHKNSLGTRPSEIRKGFKRWILSIWTTYVKALVGLAAGEMNMANKSYVEASQPFLLQFW